MKKQFLFFLKEILLPGCISFFNACCVALLYCINSTEQLRPARLPGLTRSAPIFPGIKLVLRIAVCFIISLAANRSLTFGQNFQRPSIKIVNGFKVNSYTGNLYYQRTDLKIPGRLPVDISFHYNSTRRAKDWGMGRGWTFNYNMAYATDSAGIYIERMDGKRDLFVKANGKYIAPIGLYDSLAEFAPAQFYLKSKEGYIYYFADASHKKITKLEDRNGNAITMAYTDSLLTTLTDASGRTCVFSWTNGCLTEIIDHSDPSKLRHIVYEYDTTGNPVKVTDPLGNYVRYFYAPDSRIIGMTDKRGFNTSISYYSNSAVRSIVSCITRHTFSYIEATMQTLVTENVNGQKQTTTYQFDSQGRIVHKNGNCCGFNLSYQYDANNNISSIKDGNNHETKYEYDSHGNVLRETDALGYNIAYTYEPLFNKVKSSNDKRGNLTACDYDLRGNILKITRPLNVVEEYIYDSNGDMLIYKDGNGNATTFQHNASGYITKISFADNTNVQYNYDSWGNRTGMSDGRGNTTNYEFDALNRLTRIADPLNNMTAITYDAVSNVKTVKDARNKTTNYEYDGLNRLIKKVSPLGIVKEQQYDERDNLNRLIDGNNHVTVYTYNSRKQVLTETDALGNTKYFEYDEGGNLLRTTERNGNSTRIDYDAVNQPVKITDALSGVTNLAYDPNGNINVMTNPTNNTIVFEYDELNRLKKLTDPMGKSIIYLYDRNSNPMKITDKKGNVTSIAYDKRNRIDTVIDAMNGIESYTYDGNSNLLSRTNALNFVTRNRYDPLNRIISETNPVGDSAVFSYDGVGSLIQKIKPNGNIISMEYDDDKRLTKVSDMIGLVQRYNYDNNDNQLTSTDPMNDTTGYVYDPLNRIIKKIFANHTTEQFLYDKNSNKVVEINQKGDSTLYEYDALNRLEKTTDALGYSTRFSFDASGNRTNVADAKNNITSYSYDALNRLIRNALPDGSLQMYTYDANGRPTTRTDNNGVVTRYIYDRLNRLIQRIYPGGKVDSFSYDAGGRLTAAVNNEATVRMEYDNVDRLLLENLNGRFISYVYNTSQRTKNIIYPSGMQLSWHMDARDRLIEIKESGSALASFQYDDKDRLIKKQYRNSTITDYTYDHVDNVKSITLSPGNLLRMNFEYDELNNRTLTERVHRPAFSEAYTYDKVSQLKGFKSGTYQNGMLSPSKVFQYNYDALGNRINASEDTANYAYTSNALNQYFKITVNGRNVSPMYDVNGNAIDDGKNIYQYDFENRLIAIGSDNNSIHYVYDALGRRIAKNTANNSAYFSFDGWELIEERENSNIKNYVFGEGVDEILFAKKGSSSWFYNSDPLNSVQSLIDENGNIAEQYVYDPFGKPNIFSANNIEQPSSDINNILFSGRNYEFQSNTYDFRFREMSSLQGRFENRDPLGFIDGFNLYKYVGNNPINSVDPIGLYNYVKGLVGIINVGLGANKAIKGALLIGVGILSLPESGLVGGLAIAYGATQLLGGAAKVKTGAKQLGEASADPCAGHLQNLLGLLPFGSHMDDPGEFKNTMEEIKKMPLMQKIAELFSLGW